MINVKLLHYELQNAELPVVGVTSDGRIDYSRELTELEQSIASEIITNHNPNGKLPEEQATADAIIGYSELPEYLKTMTANDASTYIDQQIWAGIKSSSETDAWIDANVVDLVSAKTALKLIATAVINMKEIHILAVKLLIYVRDLVIRFRS